MTPHPRTELVATPTPIERLNTYSEQSCVDVWVKRDDLAGTTLGGNKSRQLEYYLGASQAAGADTILITGAVQSNFVRTAAASAAKCGLRTIVQLETRVPRQDLLYATSGNVLLNRLLGAEVIYFPKGEDEHAADAALRARAQVERQKGHVPYVIPLALGNPPLGALGYVRAAREILAQAMNTLNRPNVELYTQHLKGTGHEDLLQPSLYVHAYRDAADADLNALPWQIRADHGVPVQRVSQGELQEIEPEISLDYQAAIVIQDQARATDPGALGRVLMDKAMRMGAQVRKAEVLALRRSGNSGWEMDTAEGAITAQRLVMAAGAWSARLLQPLGLNLPLEAERGYHLTFADPGITLQNSVMDVDRKFVASRMLDGLRCAGTAEFAGLDAPPNYARAHVFSRLAKLLFPRLETSNVTPWMGARPSFPDSLPAIGEVPGHPGLFAAFGHSHYGLGMAPNTGRIVIGGGLVGSAIAYGLQRRNIATLLLDEGDTAFRAARGNFGLIWTQTKGIDSPAYAQWTWASAQGWAQLGADLVAQTGVRLDYHRPGGIEICLSREEMQIKETKMERLQSHAPHIEFRMLERGALGNMLPGLGPEVSGGCLSPGDGHVNPLALLRALHAGFLAAGGRVLHGAPAQDIAQHASRFQVRTATRSFEAGRIVVAAGLGTPKLAEMVGMGIDVRLQRGQNLITEKIKPFLSMPMSTIRQTGDGGVQLGDSKEEVGMNDDVTPSTIGDISARAVRIFPHLRRARVVRTWGALRVMSPDGAPIYAQSQSCPGAYAAVCHSGVTLAAAHANILAPALADDHLPAEVAALGPERFAHA